MKAPAASVPPKPEALREAMVIIRTNPDTVCARAPREAEPSVGHAAAGDRRDLRGAPGGAPTTTDGRVGARPGGSTTRLPRVHARVRAPARPSGTRSLGRSSRNTGYPRLVTLDELIRVMDADGYDWLPGEQRFVPRDDGPARGKLPLTVQAALEGLDPARHLDRGDELGR